MKKDILYIIAIIVYPLLFIWQGLDFTDTGYALTNYQQIFNDPSCIAASMGVILTNVIGGLWMLCVGGLFGARLGGVLVTYLTIGIVYLTLRPHFKKSQLLAGLLFATLFICHTRLIDYYNLTALFFVLGTLFLIEGIKREQGFRIAIAGAILGTNIFIRFPNVIGFGLISGICFYGYLINLPFKTQLKQMGYYFFGYILAILFVVGILKLSGYLSSYIFSLHYLSQIAENSNSGYGIIQQSMKFINNNFRVAKQLIVVVFSLFLLSKSLSWLQNKNRVISYFAISVLFGLVVFLLTRINFLNLFDNNETKIRALLAVMGILYIVLFWQILSIGKHPDKSSAALSLTCFLAFLLMICTPIGSAGTAVVSIYGLWLAFPIAFCCLANLKSVSFNSVHITNIAKAPWLNLNAKETSIAKKIILCTILIISFASSYTYRDSKNRLMMCYSVAHPLLKFSFTTQCRAKVVQELVNELPLHVKQNEYLLEYESVPMVHFLTRTKPFLYGSWSMAIPPKQLKEMLYKSLSEKKVLPVIVRAKGSTADCNWPANHNVNNRPDKIADRVILEAFIEEFNYQIIWENDFFQILKPEKQLSL